MNFKVSVLFYTLVFAYTPFARAQGTVCSDTPQHAIATYLLKKGRPPISMKSHMEITGNWIKNDDQKKGLSEATAQNTFTRLQNANGTLTRIDDVISGDAMVKKQVLSRVRSTDEESLKNASQGIHEAPGDARYDLDQENPWELADGIRALKFKVTGVKNKKGIFTGYLWLNPETCLPVKAMGSMRTEGFFGSLGFQASPEFEAHYVTQNDRAILTTYDVTTQISVFFGRYKGVANTHIIQSDVMFNDPPQVAMPAAQP